MALVEYLDIDDDVNVFIVGDTKEEAMMHSKLFKIGEINEFYLTTRAG